MFCTIDLISASQFLLLSPFLDAAKTTVNVLFCFHNLLLFTLHNNQSTLVFVQIVLVCPLFVHSYRFICVKPCQVHYSTVTYRDMTLSIKVHLSL